MNKKVMVFIAAAAFMTTALSGCGPDENTGVKVRPELMSENTTVPETSSQITVTDEIKIQSESERVTENKITTVTTEAASEQTVSVISKITEQTQSESISSSEASEPVQSVSEEPKNTEPSVQQTEPPAQSAPSVVQNGETEPTYINGILIVNKTYPVPESYNPGSLTSDTQAAFERMQAAAWADGRLSLWIASGFRSYEFQKNLYNKYVSQDGKELTDTYSARPGHSEHQTGLAFDLNTIEDSFAFTPEGIWVAENCYKYGFIVRYPEDKVAQTGYKYEPWHLRYLGVELATDVYNSGLCLEEYLGITSEYNY